MINKNRLIKNFCELVKIDSPSGNEDLISSHLKNRLECLGLEVISDNYGNLIAIDGGENPLMLSAHMDTVEPGRNIHPSIVDNRIVSDQTTILAGDCKSGISAILEGIESLKENHIPHRPVEVVFTRDEEMGLVGAHNLDFSKIRSKEAIIFDGEGPCSQITSSSPTYISFDIQITGKAAHAGMEPEKGLSAIKIAAGLISKIPQGRIDAETTSNIGIIDGGSARNAVPESVTIKGEFRSSNEKMLESLNLQFKQTITETEKLYPEAEIETNMETDFEYYFLDPDDKFLQTVKTTLLKMDLDPKMQPSGGGTDGNVFRKKGIDAVVIGMATYNMHTVREYVSINELVDASRLCETLLTY